MNIFFLDNDPKLAATYHNDKHAVKMILESAQLLSTALRISDGVNVISPYTNKVVNFLPGEIPAIDKYHGIYPSESSKLAYNKTHEKHPSAKWVSESLDNYEWLIELATYLNEQCKFRFNHNRDHSSYLMIKNMPKPSNIPRVGITMAGLAMPDVCKTEDPVESYRAYYIKYKRHLASWTKVGTPYWYE